ncbi:MAG TPA: hypothetical protein VF062_02330 [Candidatus Limnocylindrales bacterium]
MGHHVEVRYLTSHGKDPEVLSSPDEVDAFIDRLQAQRLNPDDWFPDHQFQVGWTRIAR